MSTLKILPSIVNLMLQQETDHLIEFQLTDGVSPINITGDTVKFTVRSAFGGTLVFATMTNGPSGHVDPLNGLTQFAVSKVNLTTTSRSTTFTYCYEVRRINGTTAEEVVYIEGAFVLNPVVGL